MSYPDWRQRLQAVVDDGLRELRPAQVIAALAAEIAQVEKGPRRRRTGAVPAVPTTVPVAPLVLGVDASAGGWVGVVPDHDGSVLVHAAATIAEVVAAAGPVAVVAIDMPIGLPDAGRRQADTLARQALPGKGASVFTTLTRPTYAAPTYAEAREVSLATSGSGAPAQAYRLREKLLQTDAWVRSGPGVRVVEVHPELCFATMTGAPLLSKKREPSGVADRRAALAAVGIDAPPYVAGQGYAEDDLLDACAAAWSARRVAAGTATSFPETPEVFSDGLPAAIWV